MNSVNKGERDREEPAVQIRRILVALDASARSLEALEGAAELAARWKAELLGLFVEDTELLRLASAASATRFLYPAASEEPLNTVGMERELKALAEGAKRELARAAAHSHVHWSFRSVRGRVGAEILLAAAEADLVSLSLGGIGRSLFGFAVQAGVPGTHPSFLGAGHRFSTELPILVVYDGSDGAKAAFRFAVQLAEAYGNSLTVLLPSPSGRLDPEREAEVLRLFPTGHIQLRFRTIDSRDKSGFLRAIRSEQGRVLVLSGQSSLLEEGSVEALLREIDKPLLIVSGRSSAAQSTPAKGQSGEEA